MTYQNKNSTIQGSGITGNSPIRGLATFKYNKALWWILIVIKKYF